MADYSRQNTDQDNAFWGAYRGLNSPEARAQFDADVAAGKYGERGQQRLHHMTTGDGLDPDGPVDTTFINPGSADYGGSPGAADYYKNEALGHMGDNDAAQAANTAAMQRSVAEMRGDRGQQSTIDPRLAAQAEATRGQQVDALRLQRQAAMGGAPSAAAGQTALGLDQAMGQATRAGGRGLSALSGAQATRGGALGAASGGLAATGGMARSKEVTDATGLYGSTAGQVRGQDINRLGQDTQNNVFNAQQNNQWKVGNANLLAQQGNLGVAQSNQDLGWFGQAMDPAMKQFSMDQEMAAEQAGANTDVAAAGIARNRESAQNSRQLIGGAMGTGFGMLGSVAGPAGGMAGSYAGNQLGQQAGRYF